MGHIRENSSGESCWNAAKDKRFDINRHITLCNIAKGFLNHDIAKEKHEEETQKTQISERFKLFSQT